MRTISYARDAGRIYASAGDAELARYGAATETARAARRGRVRSAARLGQTVEEKIEYLELGRATDHAETDADYDAEIFRCLEHG